MTEKNEDLIKPPHIVQLPYIMNKMPLTIKKQYTSAVDNYMKNSCVEWDKVSHALGGLSKQLISITLRPRIAGSVRISPRG